MFSLRLLTFGLFSPGVEHPDRPAASSVGVGGKLRRVAELLGAGPVEAQLTAQPEA